MTEVARQYGRVFSGGSQRVWGDYNWFHKMVRGGRLGEVKEAWVNVGGPSGPCNFKHEPTPAGVDWDLWLGPAPWRPYNESLTKGNFRPFRDYSGGGMTDWGCHTFGGALFSLNLHETGPRHILPPDGKDIERLTYVFDNGVKIYHNDANIESCLEQLPDAGFHVLNWGKQSDIADVKSRLAGRMCLMGNVNPLEVGVRGTPDEVKAATLEVLGKSAGEGIILSVGGGVSPGMPRENIVAMQDALAEFNARP